ncbi:FimV-like protein [Paraburkholderia sp. HC6.4b]|uniref:FimV/HubP family polar landmark protein n=1 Tax=unclassified Paraburkholderia TaxID=2615204 RepID=UPI00160D042A|nr:MULTISPECIES: FimV/HubP family polar landmark protein [unclassified Paraburkholderia]MBB5406658.1 FimV-like protein [Paraburkholderia sp. HC6.4b]MBB5449273.1 FimV-like protein [Paraburkholderia sp. Kb1A]
MNFRRSALRAMSIRHEKVRFSSRPAAMAACATFALALLGGGAGNALAAPASATSAPDAASAVSSTTAVVAVAAGSQYTVHAGQSLNDVAIAITQSHDRAVLARATHALFDTNPAAFMNHDPSRMRVGAVLIVPALDASGALAVSSTGAAAGASESTAAAPASAPTAAPAAAAAASTASAVAQVNAAAASAASAAAQATTPAASTVSGAASAAVSTGAAAGGAVSSAPVAGSAPVATSGTREWAGSIQPAASAPAGQAPSAATAQAASQPHPQVSSLQQLLALKNRVLMELQKHGIGGAPVASGLTPTSAAQPAPAGSAATVAVAPEHANVTTSPSNEGGISQRDLSIAAAVGAALIVLLAALRMGRRKRDKEAAARAAQATDAEMARSAREADSRNGSATAGQAAVTEGSDAQDQEVARQAAAAEHAAAERAAAEQAAAESAAAERVAAERAVAAEAAAKRAAAERAAAERAAAEQAAAEGAAAEQTAAERAAAERAAAERAAAGEHAAAERAAAERAAAEQAAAEQAAARVAAEHAEAERIAAERSASERAAEEQAAQQADTPEPTALTAPLASIPLPSQSELSSEPPAVAPAHDETLRSAATAANLAAAAELGADALPLGPLEPVGAATQDENAHRLQWDEEPTESPTAEKTTGTTTTPSPSAAEPPSAASHTATAEPQSPLNVPPPVIDFTQHQIEPRATTSFGQPFSDIPVPTEPALSAPTEFPREAVDAFGSLNMPLPPRIDVPTVGEAEPSTSLSTQPVASPDTTAQQAFGVHGADDDAPHIADQIAAGTAGHGAVAGLGAAGFGALKLDFDLELPPSPAQPLSAFTPADLGRIARNKLELASEYIELGDLAGARALINEVIEANDPATRTEARALLSTLAPLS